MLAETLDFIQPFVKHLDEFFLPSNNFLQVPVKAFDFLLQAFQHFENFTFPPKFSFQEAAGALELFLDCF